MSTGVCEDPDVGVHMGARGAGPRRSLGLTPVYVLIARAFRVYLSFSEQARAVGRKGLLVLTLPLGLQRL